jgi:hypothetical protein
MSFQSTAFNEAGRTGHFRAWIHSLSVFASYNRNVPTSNIVTLLADKIWQHTFTGVQSLRRQSIGSVRMARRAGT